MENITFLTGTIELIDKENRIIELKNGTEVGLTKYLPKLDDTVEFFEVGDYVILIAISKPNDLGFETYAVYGDKII